MTRRGARGTRPAPPVVSRLDFPILSEFFHAYLHEDYLEEYGSPEAALEVFLANAPPAERRALSRECARFGALVAQQPVAVVRRLLAHDFGSAWWPARTRDVISLLDPDAIAC